MQSQEDYSTDQGCNHALARSGTRRLEGTWDGEPNTRTADTFPSDSTRAGSMLEVSSQSDDERARIRNAMFEREGLMLSLFTMLRVIPRRVLMLFKMNDLLRYV